jgi:hypothetical protein
MGSTSCDDHPNPNLSPSLHPELHQGVKDPPICDCRLEPRQNRYDIVDGILSLALAITFVRTIYNSEHVYWVVEQESVDCAPRRQEHYTKCSHHQALDILLPSWANMLYILNVPYSLVISLFLVCATNVPSLPLLLLPRLLLAMAMYIVPHPSPAHHLSTGSSTESTSPSGQSNPLQIASDPSAFTMIELQPGRTVLPGIVTTSVLLPRVHSSSWPICAKDTS